MWEERKIILEKKNKLFCFAQLKRSIIICLNISDWRKKKSNKAHSYENHFFEICSDCSITVVNIDFISCSLKIIFNQFYCNVWISAGTRCISNDVDRVRFEPTTSMRQLFELTLGFPRKEIATHAKNINCFQWHNTNTRNLEQRIQNLPLEFVRFPHLRSRSL